MKAMMIKTIENPVYKNRRVINAQFGLAYVVNEQKAAVCSYEETNASQDILIKKKIEKKIEDKKNSSLSKLLKKDDIDELTDFECYNG